MGTANLFRSSTKPLHLRYGICASAIILCGLALRYFGLFAAFTLDEIWSLHLTTQINSPLEIITALQIDNNHILNTFYMYLLGETNSWPLYRLLSFFLGVLTIPLFGFCLSRDKMRFSWQAALLCSLSMVMIIYSTEARGYAPMLFFVYLSFLLVQRFFQNETILRGLCFQLSSIGGFLAHIVFIHFYLAVLIWSLCKCYRNTKMQGVWRCLLSLHSITLVLLLLFVSFHFFPSYEIGGVGRVGYLEALLNVFAAPFGVVLTSIGGATSSIIFCIALPLTLYVLVSQLGKLFRGRDDHFLLYLLAIIILPLASLIVVRPEGIYFRYLIVSFAMLLLLFAQQIEDGLKFKGSRRVITIMLVALILLGNLSGYFYFAKYGRGNYLSALNLIARCTTTEVVSVGNMHDFRDQMILKFYGNYMDPKKKIASVKQNKPFQWLILRRPAPFLDPPQKQIKDTGERYVLVEHFPYSGFLSGVSWFVYRRHNSPSTNTSNCEQSNTTY
ncbi:hypothetical protein OAO01_02105 [Oligoflexia bacterium]|nr:hypothetical protein [Oligoflexia bacterium]